MIKAYSKSTSETFGLKQRNVSPWTMLILFMSIFSLIKCSSLKDISFFNNQCQRILQDVAPKTASSLAILLTDNSVVKSFLETYVEANSTIYEFANEKLELSIYREQKGKQILYY